MHEKQSQNALLSFEFFFFRPILNQFSGDSLQITINCFGDYKSKQQAMMMDPETLLSDDDERVYTSEESDSSLGLREWTKDSPKCVLSVQRIQVSSSSEIGRLKKVLIHRPNLGHARISPQDSQSLLFDDIVHLPQMQKEHDIFTNILRVFIGKENVLQMKDMLVEVINLIPESRADMIEKVGGIDKFRPGVLKKLSELNNQELIQAFITGYSEKHEEDLIGPIPNFIFTRDVAVTVNKHVLIAKPAKAARMRQEVLTAAIFKSHPYFKKLTQENLLIDLSNPVEFPPSEKGEVISIEGGDVMMINEDYLLVGHGERTTQFAFDQLRRSLFARRAIKNIVQINIPEDRSCMHIDTLFTHINKNHVVAYKRIVVDGINSSVIVHRHCGQTEKYSSIASFMKAEINPDMEFILSGNGKSPFQEREQWTDGCNLVTLRPGVALSYDRNIQTQKAFQKAGYKTIDAERLLKNIRQGRIDVEDIQNTIIKLPSNQLSRGRGGSHCMTCPLMRE